ncbi:hypothetical protein DTL42_08005 [Bremerella cremea]|uniref:Uncharacterized protein n=1 Tax=Bremerella cremea TaxID=1031537 RepID=A0A368KWM6_9BACT|nr:hypothetical protein [Bremerella cremea]RCS52769.1 hypothetical protein DTL42_08005 [Bremerella cremea]
MCTEANSEEPQDGMVGLDEFPPSTEPERPMIGAILFVFLGAEAFVLVLTHGWDNVVPLGFRLGQVGLLGFWLACGRARWWLRCIAVVVAIPLLAMHVLRNGGYIIFILALAALLITGLTFGLRLLVSLWCRESNEHQTISLKGIFVAMIAAALFFLVLRILSTQFFGNSVIRLVKTVTQYTILGMTLVVQCAVLWAKPTSFHRWWACGGAFAFLAFLGSYYLQEIFEGYALINEWLSVYGIGVISLWIFTYPLDWALREVGWSLVQPNWLVTVRQQRARAGRPETKALGTIPAEISHSTNEAVDFDDIH